MAFLNLDMDFLTHPKTMRLVGLLGKGSEILLIRLWIYCGKFHCENGRLDGYTAQEIESHVGWWGRQGMAVEALIKLNFIEQTEEGFAVHDWKEHQGHIHALKVKGRAMANSRWSKLKGSEDRADEDTKKIADSNTVSNAVSNAPTLPTNSLSGREKVVDANIDPGGLAWNFTQASPRGRNSLESEESLREEFRVLIQDGISGPEILAEIKSKTRNRNEPIWQLAKRLRAQFLREDRGSPSTIPMPKPKSYEEQVAEALERREAQRRRLGICQAQNA